MEIHEALARYEGNLGWHRPRSHGIGFARGMNEISFVRVNLDDDLLAAAVLATVADWHGTTGSVPLGKKKLAKAIKRLAPAEACQDVAQPSLRIWREIHGWHWTGDYVRGGSLIAVFDAKPELPTDDPYVIALRAVAASGRQAVPANEIHFWTPPGGHHPLQTAWGARWPRLEPLGTAVRAEEDRWVRFRSLPGFKRYAETPSEYEMILRRHNVVLEELGAQTPNLHVITVQIGFTPVPRRRNPVLEELLPDAECWTVLSWPYLDPELAFAHVYVNRLAWRPGRLDDLLRRVADDEIADVIISPPDLAWLYAPYDGGADLVLSTAALRDDLRERHREWLSPHRSGL